MSPAKKNPKNTDKQSVNQFASYEQQILSTSSIGVLITRIADGTILYANRAIADLLGIADASSVTGKPVPNFYWDAEDRKAILERFRAEGSISNRELRARRADGSMIWVSISIQPFSFEGEQVLLSEITDINDRMLAEKAVREGEERFHTIYDNTSIGLYRTTPAGRILMLNPAGVRMLGYDSFDEIAKRNLEETGFEEDNARKEYREKIECEGSIILESNWTRKDGSNVFVRESAKVIRDENGEVLYYDGSFEDITKRKQAEAALLESEERFRRFTEATSEGLVFHEQGRIIDANPAGLAMFGLSDFKEFVGKSLMEFVVPEFHQLVLKQMQLNNVDPYEIRCIRNDRSTFPVETSTRTYKIGDQTVRATSIRDISDRKQAEADLLLRDRALASSLNAVILINPSDNKPIYVNDALLKMTGYTREEMMQLGLSEVTGDPQQQQKIRSAIQSQGSFVGEELIKRKDGSSFYANFFSSLIIGAEGRPIAVQTSFFDITERKQAEEAVRESEERFKRFTEATVEGLVFHEQGKVVDVNPAAVGIFGLTNVEDLIGRNLLEFIRPEFHQTVLKQMQLESVTPYEILGIRKDGSSVPVETSTRAYKIGDRTIRASSIRDITQRKQAEQALQDNRRLLQLVMDNIPQAVFWKNKELTYLGANQAFAEDAGLASAQDLADKTDFDMPWKEQADLYRADDQKVLDLGEPKLNYEEPQTGPTGKVTWLRTSKIPMRDGDGNIFAILGMYEDITEWKQLQQQVQEGFERRGYQVQVGTEISQEVAAASELSDLFGRVVTLTKERLGYYHTQLLRYDAARDAVVLINGYGEIGKKMLAGGHQMPMGEGLIGTAAASGEIVLRPVLTDDPDWHPNPLLPDTQGEIAVPIKWQDTVLGVLDVQSNQAGALSDEDRLLLEGLCGQIAIAMHSAELVEIVRQNEAKLAEALLAARLANWEYDVEKDIFTFNDQFYSIFHTTAEKAGGYQLSSARYAEIFVHPDDMEVVGAEIGKALSSKERVYNTTIDHRIRYEDGGVGYITVQLTVERDENGKITRYYGANQDITERKQAEEALRINEARLADALRAARLGNWEYDFENDLFIFTDDFYSIFRTTAERVGGYKISSADYAKHFVHPDDAPLVGIEIQKVLDAKDRLFTTHLEHRIIFSDGEVGYIAVNINVERDENGKITRWYGANQDITERKQAETALRDNEAKLAEALLAARLANWEYDVEKDIFTFNDQFYSIFHTTAEKAGGYQLSSARYAELFVHPDDMEVVGAEIGKALSSTDRVYNTTIDHRIRYEDGGVGYITVQLTVERDENGKITRYYGANQDITERKLAEEALRINEARLSEALRMAKLAYWEHDLATNRFVFNDEYYAICHTTAEQEGGYTMSPERYTERFIHPDDRAMVSQAIAVGMQSTDRHFSSKYDQRLIYLDGSGIGYMTIETNIERDESGNIVRVYGSYQDITERKLAEEALRVNEARLAEALQIARLANWEYDVEKDIFTFNDQFYSLFHTAAEQHGGYQLSSAYYAQHFVFPDDLPIVGVEIEQALNSTGRHYSRNMEHRILYADGGVGHMQVNINVERDENGKITRYYGANQDITERVKQQQEVAERLEEINRLYQNLSHEGWKTYRETEDLPTGFMYDQAGLKPVDKDFSAGEHFTNVPMKVLGGEVVGTLTIADDPQNPTSDEDRAFLQQVSEQIALALESARLSAQTQSALAQSEILFEASRVLTQATDLQELVKAVAKNLNIAAVNRLALQAFSYNSAGEMEEMTLVANWWNNTGTAPEPVGARYSADMLKMLPLMVSTTPLFFDDPYNDERVDPITSQIIQSQNIRSAAILPLFLGEQQVGVLMLQAEEPHHFTEDEIRLASALAPQIATVLENRRQFERAQQQAQRESALNVIGQKIQSATTVEAVLQIAARELGHALGAPMTIAQLSMKDKQ